MCKIGSNEKRHLLIASAIVLGSFTTVPTRVRANAIAYSVTDLGLGQAFGINSTGQVVGNSNNGRAMIWDGMTPTDLGLGSAYGINDAGQVAGFWGLTNQAVRWTGTTPTTLGANTAGHGINASGQVVGRMAVNVAYWHPIYGPSFQLVTTAARWTDTATTNLGLLPADSPYGTSVGNGINSSGQVSGYSWGTYGYHAVRWTGTTPTNLGTLGGSQSWGNGINDSGQVVGWAQTAGNGGTHAVVWTGLIPADLGTLGGSESNGCGINAAGDVVGMAYTAGNAAYDAFLYTDGTMYDLFTMLLPGSGVTNLVINDRGNSINDSGQIAATGTINNQTHAIRLDPIAAPEPTIATLLLGGAVLLGLCRRRR